MPTMSTIWWSIDQQMPACDLIFVVASQIPDRHPEIVNLSKFRTAHGLQFVYLSDSEQSELATPTSLPWSETVFTGGVSLPGMFGI